jgi:hypothetical protein
MKSKQSLRTGEGVKKGNLLRVSDTLGRSEEELFESAEEFMLQGEEEGAERRSGDSRRGRPNNDRSSFHLLWRD